MGTRTRVRGRTKRIFQFNGVRGDTATPSSRAGCTWGRRGSQMLVFRSRQIPGWREPTARRWIGSALPRRMRPWSLKDHAGWRRVPELAFSFYFPLCPLDEFKGPDASFSPVSRPHTVGGCSGGPGALARVHLAGDLPFALERGGAGAGAASWGAVTACGTRLRDSRSVAACVPSALGTWLAACLERGSPERWSPARHPPPPSPSRDLLMAAIAAPVTALAPQARLCARGKQGYSDLVFLIK